MKTIFKITTTLFLLLLNVKISYSQSNENIIYSFKTDRNNEVVLAMDKNSNYIVYRYSTNNTLEFEYPKKTKESWGKFKYSFYQRGGGTDNEGMDLNYVVFSNNNFQYVIYETYYSANKESEIGIKVKDLKTNKTTDIKGNPKTKKGSLIDFRDNNLLEISEDVFY